jgi:C-terminal processing protease CtpA/Prc
MRYSKYILGMCCVLLSVFSVFAIGEKPTPTPTPPPANTSNTGVTAVISNDEGGVGKISGILTVTNRNVKAATMRPVIVLEDQVNFVKRDYLAPIPTQSQVLAHFLDDFYDNEEIGYELYLPIAPGGTFNDVDGNSRIDPGVQIYQVALWDNRFGDLYLDDREASGWSGGYNSAKASEDPRTIGEIQGGRIVVYANVDGQGFPQDFGADGNLFTGDENMVTLPVGWSVVNLDVQPFTFDRSREVKIDLIETEGSKLDDFSDMSYTEAFDALIAKAKTEYPFTAEKSLDWDELSAEFRPRFERADSRNDVQAYFDAIDAFAMSIPDGHVGVSGSRDLANERRGPIQGGIGLGVIELSDGSIVANYVGDGSQAERAGIEFGAEITAINNIPIDLWIEQVQPFFGPYSNDEQRRIGQVMFATRFEEGARPSVTFINPNGQEETAEMRTESEFDSLQYEIELILLGNEESAIEGPVEYRFTEDNIGIIEVNTFASYEDLIVQNWNFFIDLANENDAPAIIIDLRTNGGGYTFIANRLASTLYQEDFVLYETQEYSKFIGDFYADPRYPSRIEVDPDAPNYEGDVVVLVGPACASACEFFAYALTRNERATVIGQYGTYAIGGGWSPTFLPEDLEFAIPTVRKIAPDGSIVVEGSGIQPDIRVPITLESIASTDDIVLQAALDFINDR